eukprot:6328489-Pyramimonas_sp.AAC.1
MRAHALPAWPGNHTAQILGPGPKRPAEGPPASLPAPDWRPRATPRTALRRPRCSRDRWQG